MQEEASDISLDSAVSTTASDVLIQSTSVHRTGSLRLGAADVSQGLMDLLDGGLDRSAVSKVSSMGKREAAGIEMKSSLETAHNASQMHRHPDPSYASTSKSSQVIMEPPHTGLVASEAREVLCMSDHRGVLHGSMRTCNRGVAEPSQDSDNNTVHMSLKRLREIPAPVKKRDAYVPPALPANKYPSVRFTLMEETSGKN